jgi:mono/diheme cytochrome c family protein
VNQVICNTLAILACLASQTALARDLSPQHERGRQVFQYWCISCHGPGTGLRGIPYLPGTGALMAKYQGALPALLEERTDMPAELIRTAVRNGITIMPFFRKTEVSDADLEALAAYLTRNDKSVSNPRPQ